MGHNGKSIARSSKIKLQNFNKMQKDNLKNDIPTDAKHVLVTCAFTGFPAQYRIGVIEYNKKQIAKDVGAVIAEKVLDAIDKIQNHFFGTKFWPVVMDLNGAILYRADEAEKSKISAKEGWRQYVTQHSH